MLGKPVVTTDVSGMRELLGDSAYGLIVENDDEAFYHGMKRMMTDASCRARFARAASQQSKDYSACTLTEKTELFFEELINR